MAKRISIINFKGGVGKTTLAFHLATGLARYHDGKRVLLIDIDHQSSLSIVCLGDVAKWQAAVRGDRTINRVFQHLTMPGSAMPGTEIVIKSPIPRNRYPTLDLVPAALQLDDTEIKLTASQVGDAITSEWTKRTLLCQWLESTGVDNEYDYIIVDCPPATKIVTQNAIALSHGYIVPVIPEAVMERGAPHLVDLIQDGIDGMLQRYAQFLGTGATSVPGTYVPDTELIGLVVTRIKTARGYSGYSDNHTQHLRVLQRRWDSDLVTPYIEDGVGIGESLTMGLPVYDRERTSSGGLTQNVGKRGFGDQFRSLVDNLKARIDAL
ncbi:MAG: AAA family ATPase [Chloroflexota bacterium]